MIRALNSTAKEGDQSTSDKLETKTILASKIGRKFHQKHSKYIFNQPTLWTYCCNIMVGDCALIAVVKLVDIIGNKSYQSVCLRVKRSTLPQLKPNELHHSNFVTVKVPDCSPFPAYVAALAEDQASCGLNFRKFLAKTADEKHGFEQAREVSHFFAVSGISIEPSKNYTLGEISKYQFIEIAKIASKKTMEMKAQLQKSKEIRAQVTSKSSDSSQKLHQKKFTSPKTSTLNKLSSEDKSAPNSPHAKSRKRPRSPATSDKDLEILVANMDPKKAANIIGENVYLTRNARVQIKKSNVQIPAEPSTPSPKKQQKRSQSSKEEDPGKLTLKQTPKRIFEFSHKAHPSENSIPTKKSCKSNLSDQVQKKNDKQGNKQAGKRNEPCVFLSESELSEDEEIKSFKVRRPQCLIDSKTKSLRKRRNGDSEFKPPCWATKKISASKEILDRLMKYHKEIVELMKSEISTGPVKKVLKLLLAAQTDIIGVIVNGGICWIPEEDLTIENSSNSVTYLEGILPLPSKKLEKAFCVEKNTKKVDPSLYLSRVVRIAFPDHWIKNTTLMGSSEKNSLTHMLCYPDPLNAPNKGEFDASLGHARVSALINACCRKLNITHYDYAFEKEMRDRLVKALNYARGRINEEDSSESEETPADVSMASEGLESESNSQRIRKNTKTVLTETERKKDGFDKEKVHDKERDLDTSSVSEKDELKSINRWVNSLANERDETVKITVTPDIRIPDNDDDKEEENAEFQSVDKLKNLSEVETNSSKESEDESNGETDDLKRINRVSPDFNPSESSPKKIRSTPNSPVFATPGSSKSISSSRSSNSFPSSQPVTKKDLYKFSKVSKDLNQSTFPLSPAYSNCSTLGLSMPRFSNSADLDNDFNREERNEIPSQGENDSYSHSNNQ